MTSEVRFDDPAALDELIAQGFGEFGDTLEITQAMIDTFADLTGDHQWIHVDVTRAAAETEWGSTIAHGMLVLGVLPPLAATAAPARIVGHRAALNYGAESLRFVAPVPSGSVVHARVRFVRHEPRSRGTLVVSEVEIHVVGADRPAIVYRPMALYVS